MKSMFSYAAGDIMIKIFGILLVPITTRLLSVSDYGIMSCSRFGRFYYSYQFRRHGIRLCPLSWPLKTVRKKDSVLKTALLPVSWVIAFVPAIVGSAAWFSAELELENLF